MALRIILNGSGLFISKPHLNAGSIDPGAFSVNTTLHVQTRRALTGYIGVVNSYSVAHNFGYRPMFYIQNISGYASNGFADESTCTFFNANGTIRYDIFFTPIGGG
jgi:hypothetical protein